MSEQCFIICPIGEKESEERIWSDYVFDTIVYPVVTHLDFEPIRSDKIPDPGIIHDQVVNSIIDSPIVITDLTFRNPNVYYELALRHCVRKAYILMIRSGDKIPFDVGNARVIQIDVNDPEETKKELERQIKSIYSGTQEIQNPISVVLDRREISILNQISEQNITITFDKTNLDIIELASLGNYKRYSRRKAEEIEKILEEKKEEAKKRRESATLSGHNPTVSALSLVGAFTEINSQYRSSLLQFQFVPYEDRSIEDLENLLKNSEKEFLEENQYEVFELFANKVNFIVSNTNSRYIKDCSIRIEIPRRNGIIIPNHIFRKPDRSPISALQTSIIIPRGYPEVNHTDSKIIITEHVGDIKHFIPKKTFGDSLRITLTKELIGETIELSCVLKGENLTKPIEKKLRIRVISPEQPTKDQ